ncbi:MAG: nucleoside triphosphate pyrophosphohydrolase family protein [Thermoplasmata archaeon]
MDDTQFPCSNYERVREFHQVFDHPHPESLQKDIFEKDPKLIQFRLSLIEEEFNELKRATDEKNMEGVIDALADLLYVTYGMGVALGIDLDRAFKIVHESNMSKLCHSEQEAMETIEYYNNIPEFSSIDVKYRPSLDGNHLVIYNAITGKILKSKYYTPPNFEEMLK